MKWDILHRTRYDYAEAVRDNVNDVCLQPLSDQEQTLESFLLKVLPAARLSHFMDPFANRISHFEIAEAHNYLLVEAQSRVTTHARARWPAAAQPCSLAELRAQPKIEGGIDYLSASRFVESSPEASRLAAAATAGVLDAWQAIQALMTFVYGHLKYESYSTHVHTHMSEVLRDQRGVCQDFAHVLIGLCHELGIPARYVSGYLATESARATHAWMEVHLPNQGWRGLDPTHNRQTDESYVKIGHGRDYSDVPPVSGKYRGTLIHRMTVTVDITPVV
jgi:transglutaminase-like putative cysteine protease